MAEIEISADQVPAEALAAFSTPSPTEVEIDPVDTLDAAGLFELSKNKMFSPLEWAQANPDRATDPAIVQKLSDTHARIRERGFTFSDLPTPTQALKGVGHMVAGLAKQSFNYASAIAAPFIDVAASVTGQSGPGFSAALAENAQRGLAENIAGTEAAATGLAQLPGKAISKLGQLTGLSKPYTQQTDAEKAKAFFSDLGTVQQGGEIAQGRGAVTQAVSGEVQKELAEAEKPVRPEEIELTTAGDPLSFLAFGKLFGAAGKLLPSVPGGAAFVEKSGEAAVKVGGRAIQGAGKLTEMGGKAARAVTSSPITGAGAIGGAMVSGDLTTAIGVAVARPMIRAGARGIESLGAKAADIGKQVATGQITSPYAQAARDILQSSPVMASDVLSGAAFDLGLAAATSESPQETEAAAAFGTVLGGLKGVSRGALKVAQGQIVTPRAWGTTKATPAYRSFSSLDALHAQAQAAAPPGEVMRVNAIREFLKGADDKSQAYLMPDRASMERAVNDILIRQGQSPEVAAETARNMSQSNGMLAREWRDDAGQVRRVVLLNEANAAPHESFHAIQNVLGENANTVIDGMVFQEYAPQWEALGQRYASLLGGTGNWREVILDRSGWGNLAAAEKALRDAANKIRNDTGAEPRAADARALAEKVLQQARDSGAQWREILTPEEAAAEANRYLARELAAENFDIAFKNLGAGLTEGNSLPEKLARIVARTAAFMGAEPLAGVKTEGLQIEPRLAITEAVTRQGREAMKPATPTEVKQWAKLPETTAEGAAEADKVITWLQDAKIPIADRAAAAQTLAEAMRNQQGVRLSYWGAKGEPGGDPAALRPERRAEIEAQRDTANADRDLVTKDYFPYGAIITSKGPQFKGWSPNNFNANVARFAEWITANPEAARRLPLAHDLATEAGQRGLQADLQTFVQNQQAGFTGSGLELVIPAGTGATPPVKTGVQPVSLPQERADAISYLFNLKLPESPRITSGKLPLNIVGQRVSEATVPGRLIEPIRPRGEFTGPKAEALGIAGERVQEVNPFRQAVEQAAKDAGAKPPELIEAAQILALDRIADATVAPELPAFGGNVVTLTAGFLPEAGREWKITGQRGGIRSETTVRALDETTARKMATAQGFRVEKASPTAPPQAALGQFLPVAKELDGIKVAAIRSPDGKIYTGSWHGEAVMNYIDAVGKGEAGPVRKATEFEPAYDEGFLTESGRFLNREEAATHARRIGQMPGAKGELENDSFRRAQQFLPGDAKTRKSKKEFKLLPASAGISKAWVLPGGKVEQLGGQWHHDWLDQNKAIQEKYGLEIPTFSGGDAEGVRESALKKGFVRVNYSKNSGTLTVEARARDWRRQKVAVERLIEENLDNIDNLNITLLDESATKIVDSAAEKLFNYDENVEKMANLPFISKGEIRGGAQFLPGEVKTRGEEILAMSPAEFSTVTREWQGGLTGQAKVIGLGATSIEDVNLMRQFEAEAKAKGAAALKNRDFDAAMSHASVSQLWREAREAAQGLGGIGEALRRDLGEAYIPPVPAELDK